MNPSIHVVPHEQGWIVTREGSSDSAGGGQFHLKSDAVKFGRVLAVEEHAELVVHNRNGRIGYRNSYGGDSPRRPG